MELGRDPDHIEKAFDIGGMGARNGVTAVAMVQTGFTGVRDVLSGTHNAIEALSSQPHPEAMMADLGSRFFVSETGIKTYSVGYPNQAPLDAFLTLRRQYGLRADNVERIVVRLPEDAPGIVNNSPMPDVNCQYLIATALVDGARLVRQQPLPRAHGRSANPRRHAARAGGRRSQAQRSRRATQRPGGSDPARRPDGEPIHALSSGHKGESRDTEGMNAKARDLMAPVLGAKRTETLIQRVNALEEVGNMREFVRSLLTA